MRPARPRGTKAAPLTTASQQDLLLAGLTSQAQQPMGQETAREISVKLALHISWHALGIGVVVERGEKRFQMCRAHVVEDGAPRIPWLVGGSSRRHESTTYSIAVIRGRGNVTNYTAHMRTIQEKY